MYEGMEKGTAGAWGRGEVRGYSRILEEASPFPRTSAQKSLALSKGFPMYDDTALRRLLIELAASHPEHAAVIRVHAAGAGARQAA